MQNLNTVLLLLQDGLFGDPGGLLGANDMLPYQLHDHWVTAAIYLRQECKAGRKKIRKIKSSTIYLKASRRLRRTLPQGLRAATLRARQRVRRENVGLRPSPVTREVLAAVRTAL